MQKLKQTQDIVKHILETQPDTRNSDDLLYAKVCEYSNKSCLTLPFCMVITNRKTLGIPPFESVRRTRQKLQAAHSELSATDTVEVFRAVEEIKYRNYARQVNV